MVGDKLLVAPILEKGATRRDVYKRQERFLWALALFTGEVLRSGRDVVGTAPLGFYSHVMDMPFYHTGHAGIS